MDIQQAQSAIKDLMVLYGLEDWELTNLPSKRKLGVCRYGPMEIGVNWEYISLSEWPEVEQVALHEIAHALAGPGTGHGPLWKEIAEEIGVKNPAAKIEMDLPGRYRATCSSCGRVSHRHRLTRRMTKGSLACGPCCQTYAGGKFSKRFALTYVDTYATRRMIALDEPTEGDKVSTTYSAPELAARIGTDPKTLRRFLRENDSFRNPGSGKRYEFTERDAASVEKAFKSWDGKRSKRAQTTGETRPKNKNEQSAAERKKRAQERVDALETSLKSRGVHISQHR